MILVILINLPQTLCCSRSNQELKNLENFLKNVFWIRIGQLSFRKGLFCNVGDLCLIPGLGRSPGGGHGNPLQYSCLENPIDRGAWQATVHGVTKSQAQLSDQALHGTAMAFIGFILGHKMKLQS